MTRSTSIPLLAIALAACPAPAQHLRKALVDADLVVVARQTGQRKLGEDVVLHRLQIVAGVRGHDRDAAAVTVLDWPQLSRHQRPAPRQQRLYCLVDARRTAQRLSLPAEDGPYYKMVGWSGSNPAVLGDLDQDPALRFARLLAAAEEGAPPVTTAATLAEMALSEDPAIRVEAARLLAERPDLRSRLSAPRWSDLLARTSGEQQDVDYKIALAELCAAQRLDGLVDALIVGFGSVQSAEYARAVGRLSAHLRGEGAVQPLLRRLQTHNAPDERSALLLALGATRTTAALDALLEIKRVTGDDAAVDAALREHRSRRALDAVRGADRDK